MGGRLLQDIRFAVRLFAKNPAFTIIAILTLALGIGATSAIFTVANAVLFEPLPFANPSSLVLVSLAGPDSATGFFSYARYTFLRDHAQSFAGLAAFTNESFNLSTSGSDPEQLAAARVSSEFFHVLGVQPAMGRTFLSEEDTPSGKPVVLISHELWMRRFGGNAGILGQTVTLNTQPYTIIGVMPAGFQFGFAGGHPDIWAPRVFDLNLITPQQVQGGIMFLNAIARLKPGGSHEQAQAEIRLLDKQYQHDNSALPDADPKYGLIAADLREQLVGGTRPAILLLFGAVVLVLLIACANVASLLLSRALVRKKEIALRTALGATRGTLIRQLLTESVLLALIAGALGVFLSLWATRALASVAAQVLPRAGEIQANGAVLVFSLAISLLTGLLFGLMPALETSRADLNAGLRDEGRGSTAGRGRAWMRATLVAGQVALSVTLLIGSGLLIRSFVQLLNVGPGVDTDNTITMNIALPPARYTSSQQIIAFFDDLVRRVENVPGVRAAALASALPVNPVRSSPALPEGQPAVPLMQRPMMNLNMIGPGYFRAMGTPLLRGRDLNEHDDARAPRVAVINHTLAKRFWPNEDAVGKHILLGRMTAPLEVVGETGDIKNVSLASAASPEIYVPYAQVPWRSMNLVVRTAGDPQLMTATIRRQVTSIDKDQPVTAVRTLDELFAASRAHPRLMMLLIGVFSAAAFLLAVVGLYGTLSYLVSQRTQEVGIRMALGAGRGDILAMVIRQGMTIALCGVAGGLALSFAAVRLMSGLLFEVSLTDPVTYAASAVAFSLVALLASYMPARRATRVDPSVAMR